MTHPPRLSAILIAPEGFEPVATTVRHLSEQSAAADLEVVLVAPPGAGDAAAQLGLRRFAGWQVVELPEIRSNASGYAAGVRAANAPVVVFCEDHCYPGPGWAEALLSAHEDSEVAAVGPVVASANTDGAIAWTDFLLGYGPWLDPTPSGDVDYLPGHNSSYKREALLEYEPELGTWLDAEVVLHWDLRRHGRRLRLESAARTNHFSFSRPTSWLAATYLQSRTFSARRTHGSGAARRLIWLLATPLIPAVRLRRCLRDVRRWPDAPPIRRILPALSLALLVSAAGEAVGYACGDGAAPERVSRYETLRERHMNARDGAAMAAARFWARAA